MKILENSYLTRLLSKILLVDERKINDSLTFNSSPIWDSLSKVSLALEIEEAYSINLTSHEIAMLKTVKDLKDLIKSKGVKL